VAEIAPQDGDLVIVKPKVGACFGTLLAFWLITMCADTVLVTGLLTSGCARPIVVDAAS
jgi:nicotinamidase-related amidase